MKRNLLSISRLFAVLILLLGFSSTASLYAQTTANMPSEDWDIKEYTVDGQLTLYDSGGADNSSGYTKSMVRLKPSVAGLPLSIKITTLKGGSVSSTPKVYLYSGVKNWDTEEDWYGGWENAIPANADLTVEPKDTPASFQSTSSDGVITLVLEAKYNTDFVAEVTQPVQGPMTFKGAELHTTSLQLTVGKKQATLLSFDLLTEGNENPLQLSAIKLQGIDNTFSNIKIKLGEGNATPFDPATGEVPTTPLASGKTKVTLYGDIATSIAFDSEKNLAIESVTLSGAEQRLDPAKSCKLTLVGDALMESPHNTFVVDKPLTFYDDGGANGKISLNFEGKTTFLPADPSKKIVIEFTNLNLFNTSSTGKNDILKVYSGSDLSTATLLGTFLKDLGTLYSTAEDGSLIVTLKSTTGYGSKDGFVATVKAETPQDMEFKGVSLTPVKLATPLSAISSDVEVATLDLTTQYSAKALELRSVSCNVSGAISEVALYNEAGTKELGRAKVADGASTAQIVLTDPFVLGQISNLFSLRVSINEKSPSDASYQLSLLEVESTTGKKVTPAKETEVKGNTDNTVIATIGTQKVTLYSPWQFTHEKKSYGDDYETTAGNRIVTFYAPQTGDVVTLDFASFALNIPNYGSTPEFKIYDGENTEATLLWEATQANKAAGPGEMLFSSGRAMTIAININGSYSGKGWQATVAAQKAPRLGIKQLVQEAEGSSFVSLLSTEETPIAKLTINAASFTSPRTYESLEVEAKGNHSLVKQYKLYLVEGNEEKLVCELAPSTSDLLQFAFPTESPLAVSTGFSTFVLKVIPNGEATGDNKLTYRFTKLTFKGETPFEIEAPATPIEKQFVSIVEQHTEGDPKTYKVPSGSSLLYTDDGGSDGTMMEGEYETVVTFLPANEGEIVFFDIQSMKLARTAEMLIYEGTKVNKDNLLLEIGNKLPQNLCWGNLEHQGALTVLVKKKNSKYVKLDGWKIEVTSKVPSDRKVTASSATARADQEALYGATFVPVLDFDFTIEGEAKGAKIPTLSVSAPGATAVRFSFAGEEAIFSKALPSVEGVKQEGSDNFLIQDETLYPFTGKVYGYLSIDMPTESISGEKITVTLSKLGDETITDTKAVVTLKNGLKGEYTIGAEAGASYATLDDALKALEGGVSGPVTFLLSDGTYEGMYSLSNIPGASEKNPIKFTSKSGKAQDVTITHKSNASSGGYRLPQGLFIVDATPYVTIEAITFKATKKVADDLLYVSNGSSHFTLKSCILLSQEKEPSGYSDRFGGVKIEGGKENYSHCDFVTIEENRFVGGDNALDVSPVKNVAFVNSKGVTIRNNYFENAYSKMIFTSTGACEDLVIEGNKMTFNQADAVKEIWAMDLSLAGANEKIVGNSFYSENHSYITAFYLRKARTKQVYHGSSLFANNSAVITKPENASQLRGPAIKGIYFSDGDLTNLTIAHNTIRLELGETPSASEGTDFSNDKLATCILARSSKGLVVKNNLFYNSRKGLVVRFDGLEIVNVSHNGYFSPSEKPFAYQYENPDKKVETFECSFDEWKARMTEEGTVFLQPTFLDPKSAALKDGKAFNVGEAMEEISTDIAGFPRSKEHPTVGAYEYAEDYDKELKLNDATLVATTANSATIGFVAERSAKLFYQVRKATDVAPAVDDLLTLEPMTCIAGTKEELLLEKLEPMTEYTLYGVLKALTEDKTSDLLTIISFETAELPTEPASFDNVENYQEGKPFTDGTMQFTGFTIAKEAENGIASLADGSKGEVALTNTTKGLLLKSMLIRGKGEVVLTTDLDKSRTLKLDNDKEFVLVGLESLGLIKTLTLQGGSKVAIDNLGYAPEEPSFATITDQIVKAGESALPEVKTLHTAVPYKVSLTINGKKTLLEEVWTPTAPLGALTLQNTAEALVEITDDLGRSLHNSFFVVVNPLDGTPQVATFEEPLNDDAGEEAYYRIKKGFYSGSFKFANSYNAEWDSWSGFSVSRSTKTNFIDYSQSQWNVPSGHGAEGSKSFGVFFKSFGADDAIMMVDPLIAQPLHGMYVSITSYTLSHVENGDSMLPDGFQDGNYYEVKVTADNGKSVTIPVADYRNGKKEVLKEWTWVSFKELGNVKSLTFTVDGNAKNDYGLVTPAYLAIDNINDSTNPVGNEGIIRSVMPEMHLAGNTLIVKNAQGVLVSLYDLSGRLVYQVRPTSDFYSEELSIAEGTYIAVCAGARTKLVL